MLPVALGLLVSTGCGSKLNLDQTVKLTPEKPFVTLIVDAPRGEQKVAVTAQSDQHFSLWVAVEDEKNSVLPGLEAGHKPANPLAALENTKRVSVEVTIPAKKPFYVLLARVDKEADVKVTMKNK
jgi:hypothetical protein